ncbi:spore cortex biosynthesis protein YabQ [Clostridium grantii]|uniref:Spore cortex biosynthesis protein YabQ n=1 Tax=Clostridium grantii DSM 8605 TaxID=1121316 RepID=A0A1M5X9P0_9CLOT|nr:spore cortex biosynthesis protein YabQ [Clostridium grantii]SHH96372.1 spore cortex biosynthesis protein YabQ [Clostridium grantii DSM 8605]
MIMSIDIQIKMMIYSLFTGIITGILFDVYRTIRGFENPNKVLTVLEDILFWILVGLLDFIFLLYNNYAYIGIYVYGFLFLGIFLYIKFSSKVFIKTINRILLFIVKIIRVVLNIIMYPFNLFYYNIIKKNRNNS